MDGDGRIEFSEFYRDLQPIWKFGIKVYKHNEIFSEHQTIQDARAV